MPRKPPAFSISADQYRGLGSEAEWRNVVKEMAEYYGWIILFELPDKGYAELGKAARTKGADGKWHLTQRGMIPVMNAVRGQPDLLLGHPAHDRAIVVELKIPGQEPDEDQMTKLDAYRECGIEPYVWHTGDDEAGLVLGNPEEWYAGWTRP